MGSSHSISEMAAEMRAIYRLDPERAPAAVEAYLRRRLADLPIAEQLLVLERIQEEFASPGEDRQPAPEGDRDLLSEVFSLFLGTPDAPSKLPPEELLNRLAESLNLVFSSLNRLVGIIQSTLMGRRGPDETIRHLIRDHLEGEDRMKYLERYIGQIGQAFLLSQTAFTASAETIVGRLLAELSPEAVQREEAHGLRFGPLRKAESFDRLGQKHAQCRAWLESGRFKEDLLREFERACEGKLRFGNENHKGDVR